MQTETQSIYLTFATFQPNIQFASKMGSRTKMVDLNKKLSLHKESAKSKLAAQVIPMNSAHVAVVLDVSKSMYKLYHSGIIQHTLEQLLGLALALDSNNELDSYVFGTGAARLETLTETSVDGFVSREIIEKRKINQQTNYAQGIQLVNDNYFGTKEPVFVIFITDGDAGDKTQAKAWLQQLSRSPFFIKFIGIGKEKFQFLEKLEELGQGVLANTSFVKAGDLVGLTDSDLYDAVLGGYAAWLTKAKQKNILQI